MYCLEKVPLKVLVSHGATGDVQCHFPSSHSGLIAGHTFVDALICWSN